MIQEYVEALDHGYVKLIEVWGSDERVIESARMSTDGAFRGWGPIHDDLCASGESASPDDCNCTPMPGDEKLLKFLWTNRHTSPFEQCGATFELKFPIMVSREQVRHRTLALNEMSGRYIPLPAEDYVPTVTRLMVNAGLNVSNKQAGTIEGAEVLTEETAAEWLEDLKELYAHCELVYQKGLRLGVPKEMARLAVTVGRYTKMRVTGNLLNWGRYFGLRLPANAQWEIRLYAGIAHAMLHKHFPRSLECFDSKPI
jgi:thymidylate synthase (FAD)